MKFFYAVEFRSGPTTTTGEPNPRTGRCNQAITPKAFRNSLERNVWVDSGRVTSDMQGNCREAVSRERLRHLLRGLSGEAFQEKIEYLQLEADNE